MPTTYWKPHPLGWGAINSLGNLKQGVDAIYNSPRYNPNITEKKCSVCGVIKSLSEFYKDGNGLRADCILCDNNRLKQKRRTSGHTPLLTLWEAVDSGYRICTKCGIKKSLSEFRKRNSKTGTTSHCTECIRNTANSAYVPKTAETSRVIKQREDMVNGFRVCGLCQIRKLVSDFPKHGNGTRTMCKVCYNIHQSLKRSERKDSMKTDDRQEMLLK